MKTGGRGAGTPNAVTALLREEVERAAGGKPLPVLLAEVGEQARAAGDLHLAVAAYAKAAAYVYPRLQTVVHKEDPAPLYPLLFVGADGKAVIPDSYPGPVISVHREVIGDDD
jgi:hypothetical protein